MPLTTKILNIILVKCLFIAIQKPNLLNVHFVLQEYYIYEIK